MIVRECHKLKIKPEYFADVLSGSKTFEVRKDDRGFSVGDTLALFEFGDTPKGYTGFFVNCKIVYKLSGGRFGIEDGYCVLGIAVI